MAINPAYVGTPPGIIKLVHIIFGIIAIGCGGHSMESEYVFERVFLWTAVTCLIISVIYFLLHFASESVPQSSANKGVDMLYHVLAGILLITGGSLMIVSVKKFENEHCDPLPWGGECVRRKGEKLAGASFSIINGVFYLIAVPLIAMQKQEDPDFKWDSRVKGYQTPSAQSKRNTTEDPEE